MIQWQLRPLGDPGRSVWVTPNYMGEKCGLSGNVTMPQAEFKAGQDGPPNIILLNRERP